MQEKNVKEVIRYFYGIPEMVRLLREEEREQEERYCTLKGTDGEGVPGGGGSGKPVEDTVIRLDEQGVWERLQEIRVRMVVLQSDAAAVRGCLDSLSGKYKSILQMRHRRHYSWGQFLYVWARRKAQCAAGMERRFSVWETCWTKCRWQTSFWLVLRARVHIKRRGKNVPEKRRFASGRTRTL